MVFTEDKRQKLVYTIPDKCRVCYTCVRECPAKAIRIENGQAAVIYERCIACGNCVKVCSQGAKAYLLEGDDVQMLLESDRPVFALLAPSFPAEFTDLDSPEQVVGLLKKMGFDRVFEVSFGADLVARRFQELITDPKGISLISSDCPAIVQYVEHYHPDLVSHLAPVVSPMMATARVVRHLHGPEPALVFIGPCIGKKAETGEIEAGITFAELRDLLQRLQIRLEADDPCGFDGPGGGRGGIFPVKRGLLQALRLPEDLFEGRIMVAEGRAQFPEAIAEFENGSISDQHMELLCCEGCIMGPGMSRGHNRFQRRSKLGEYMRRRMDDLDTDLWKQQIDYFYEVVDLNRNFTASDRRLHTPDAASVEQALRDIGKKSEKDHLNCGACGYESCYQHAVAIVQGLAEPDMCLPNVIDKLASAKQALKHSEKMAHMGQLSAGIAHELNNPLGVVMMYANLLLDEYPEGRMADDLKLIVSQTDRCKRIVGNLLNFARKNQIRKELCDVHGLVRDSLQSILIPESVAVRFDPPVRPVLAELDLEQMIQVLTNICKNAVEAMPSGGELTARVDDEAGWVLIRIRDTGTGIPEENRDKLFTPFFTTKEYGKGTGLGLATSYGIVKMHRGKIEVESNADPGRGATGTCFTIKLPTK